jgi:hypothetical protein
MIPWSLAAFLLVIWIITMIVAGIMVQREARITCESFGPSYRARLIWWLRSHNLPGAVVRSPIIRRRPTYPDLENGLEEQLLLVDIGNVTLCMPSVDHCGSSISFVILDPPVLIFTMVISGYLLWLINFIFPELLYKNSLVLGLLRCKLHRHE